MIVVVEGCSGAGKSTLAKALAERLDCSVFRLMRDCEEELLAGVAPTNTYHQDVYATDALVRVGADVVWDRSLPSGLARIYEETLDDDQRERLICWWAKRLAGHGLLINLIVEPVIALARHRHGFSIEHIRTEQSQIEVWCEKASAHGLTTVVLAGGDLEAVTEIALTAIWEVKKK